MMVVEGTLFCCQITAKLPQMSKSLAVVYKRAAVFKLVPDNEG